MMARVLKQWLRKRLCRLMKLHLLALGLIALLMTTNLLDTLKVMWGASKAAATALQQTSQIKQSQPPKP